MTLSQTCECCGCCRAHKAADTDRRVEIVERLLIEEERMKKRKEAYPYLFTDASTDKAKVGSTAPSKLVIDHCIQLTSGTQW